MFPVLSLLRRAAGNVVYAELEYLVKKDGKVYAELGRKTQCANFFALCWTKPQDHALMFELKAVGTNPARAAILLTEKENEIAKDLDVAERLFTLIVSEEEEEVTEEGTTRTVRMALARGIFGPPKITTLPSILPTSGRTLMSRKIPAGATRD